MRFLLLCPDSLRGAGRGDAELESAAGGITNLDATFARRLDVADGRIGEST